MGKLELTDNNTMQLIGTETLIKPLTIPNEILSAACGVGDGWKNFDPSQINSQQILVDFFPHAVDLLALAKIKLAKGELISPSQAFPTYLH